MDSAISVTVTPLQAILAVAFQLWIVVFPILLIKKINYLTALMHDHFDSDAVLEGSQSNEEGE